MRQLYMVQVERLELDSALETATQMGELGVLLDVAHHDRSRVLLALGLGREAIQAQRLAVRTAEPKRRSFHLWSLATLEHHQGDTEAALSTLARAMRYAVRDRALIKAHAAYIKLDAGQRVQGVEEIMAALRDSKNSEGYGQYVLGMLAYLTGDALRTWRQP